MITRRQFVCNATLAALAGCATSKPGQDGAATSAAGDKLFTLGVASGDPAASSVVLWTRLAPELLSGNPLPAAVEVRWLVASDPGLTSVVAKGSVLALPEDAHSVHVEPAGLQPDTVYYYRFEALGALSPTGRTRTLPSPGARVDSFSIALTSCMEYSLGYFVALRDLDIQQPNLVIHNGDYIYEAPSGSLRPYPIAHEAMTLADYRSLYARYRQDAALRRAHEQFPWVVLWDDHEVVNDSGPGHYLPSSRNAVLDDDAYQLRRRAATKAFLEHMPTRAALASKRGNAPEFHARSVIGDLLELNYLDVRSYRDTPVCNEGGNLGFQDCAAAHDPSRSMLGASQEQWLFDNFGSGNCRWNCLVQTTVMAPFDRKAGLEVDYETDGWDNYAANRDRIVDHVRRNGMQNSVVLGGNIHAYYAGTVDSVMTEIVTTSVSASGGGEKRYNDVNGRRDENPELAYFDNRYRGYTLLEFAADQVTVSLRVVRDIEVEDSTVSTLDALAIADGKVGISPV